MTLNIEQWIETYGGYINKICDAQTLDHWHRPITIDPIKDLFDRTYCKKPVSKKKFYAILNNVYINNGKIFDQGYTNEVKEFSNCGIFSRSSNKLIIENAIHLVDQWGGINYWHWLSTCLAKLFLTDYDSNSAFIINSLDRNFVKQSLEKFGINCKNCVEIDKVNEVFCKKLIAISPIGDRDAEGFIYLREKLRNKNAYNKHKILISRKNIRKIVNEGELFDIIKPLGFIRLECENLTFEEQINYFSGAEAVIAPHGAGLSNVIFVPTNTKILELRSPEYFGSCYWKLCNHLNLQYYSLIGEGQFPEKVEDLSKNLNSNIIIDLKKFKKTLELMGMY